MRPCLDANVSKIALSIILLDKWAPNYPSTFIIVSSLNLFRIIVNLKYVLLFLTHKLEHDTSTILIYGLKNKNVQRAKRPSTPLPKVTPLVNGVSISCEGVRQPPRISRSTTATANNGCGMIPLLML